ncbi:MAG: DUF2974 domain-containing protein [Lachnospiraceae bacterium]|nr:DUF2974 domain-containing protein [Lachnospiraceae bacterium]
MSAFSEEDLLLLNNYIYMDMSMKYDNLDDALDAYSSKDKEESREGISKRVFEPKAFPENVGGGLNDENAAEVFKRLDKATDKGGSLEGVRITRTLNEGNVRAMCVEKPTGEAAVIFRGTGGSFEAWEDNVEGEFLADTDMQRIAADFIEADCGGYKDLTVSGHSKGGNLAQYVTVVCAASVGNCISFDGQGFGREFLEKYPDEVEKAKGKITSICAHNDYVNILLNPIAGETVYVSNKNSGPVGAHSSFSLIEHGIFDESGRVLRDEKVKQSMFARSLDRLTDSLTGAFDILPDKGNKAVSGVLAAVVADIMCCEKDVNDIDETGSIKKAVGKLYNYIDEHTHLDLLKDDIRLNADNIYGNFDDMQNTLTDLNRNISVMKNDMYRIEEIQGSLSEDIISGMCLSFSMNSVKERIYKDIEGAGLLCECLNDIRRIYKSGESSISEMISGN